MNDLLNGFNNGRDKSDGIGGNKPINQLVNGVDTRKSGLHLQNVSVSFDDEIDAELERRRIVQYNDDDNDPHWDEGKLYWARKMFREGAKWANER